MAGKESTNEAARCAVNAILQKFGFKGETGGRIDEVWEPPFFAPMIEFDRLRFKLGLGHSLMPL